MSESITATGKASEIERLGNLLKQGLLSDTEFQVAKQHVLSQPADQPTKVEEDVLRDQHTMEKQPAPSPRYLDSKRQPKIETKYEVAQGLLYILSAVGWLLVLVGIFVFLTGVIQGHEYGKWIGGMAGLATVAIGLLQVAVAQIAVTMIDTADHTREIFRLLSKQHSPAE
ncbi:MAG: hypothetical protein Q8L93_08195 [Rhodocyclaceae bacterium]|nr:hypothetical protein [Rhodocyclaceae bacterium]